MATPRDENIKVNILRGNVDRGVESLLSQLGRGRERTVNVNLRSQGAIDSQSSSRATSSLRQVQDEPVKLSVNVKHFEEEVTSALRVASQAIEQFNKNAVIKIRVDTSEVAALEKRLSSLKSGVVGGGSSGGGSRQSTSASLSGGYVEQIDPNFRKFIEVRRRNSIQGYVDQVDPAFKKSIQETRKLASQGIYGNVLEADKSFLRSIPKTKALNDTSKLSGQFSEIALNPSLGSYGERSKVEKQIVDSMLKRVKQDAVQNKAASRSQLRNQVDDLRFSKIKEEFYQNSTISEFGSFLLGGKEGRFQNKLKQAKELEKQKGQLGLADRLTAGLTADSLGKETPLLSLSRLKSPAALAQVAFGGVFGGGAGLAAAGLGAAVGGAPGALLASTIQQAVGGLIDPVLQGIKKHEDEFKEAGEVYSRSILGIASVLNTTSRVIGVGGRTLNEGENASDQIRLQERRATDIQLSARGRLSQLGIAGQQEATFVQGIVSALASRGINASGSQVATIAERLGGAIQAQRPQLLDNPSLLLRDVEDYIGGGPQAKRTVVSQLAGLRSAGTRIQTATTAEGIISALAPAAGFADAVRASDSTASLLAKQRGAEDQLQTLGGEEYFKALQPALKEFVASLQSDEFKRSAQELGAGLGAVANVSLRVATLVQQAGTGLVLTFGEVAEGLSRLPGLQPLFGNRDTKESEALQDEMASRLKAQAALSKPTAEVDSILKSAGLDGILTGEFEQDSQKSALSRVSALRRAISVYDVVGPTQGRDSSKIASLYGGLSAALGESGEQEASLLDGLGSAGQLSALQIRGGTIDSQLEALQKRSASLGVQRTEAETALQKAASADRRIQEIRTSGITVKDQFGKEVSSGGLDSIRGEIERLSKLRDSNVADANRGRAGYFDTLIPKNERDLKEAQNRLTQVNAAIKSEERLKQEATGNNTPQVIEDLNNKIALTQRDSLKLESQKLALSEQAAVITENSLKKIQSGTNLDTESGARGFSETAQKKYTQVQDAYLTGIKSLNTQIKKEEKLRQDIEGVYGPRSPADIEKLKQSRIRQGAFEGLREDSQANLNLAVFEKSRAFSLGTQADINKLRTEQASFNPETLAGQKSVLEKEAAIISKSIGDAMFQRQEAYLENAKNPNGPRFLANKQLIEQSDLAINRGQVSLDQNRQLQELQPFKQRAAETELALNSVRMKEVLQSEITQRIELNNQLAAGRAALSEFSASLIAKSAGKESEIFTLAQRYKELGGSLPNGVDVDEDTLASIQRNAVGAQLNAATASVGRKDLSVDTRDTVTGLFNPRLGSSSFQVGLQSEQAKLSETVSKTAIELDKLPLAIKQTVDGINRSNAELTYLLSTPRDTKQGPNPPEQGPPSPSSQALVSAQKRFAESKEAKPAPLVAEGVKAGQGQFSLSVNKASEAAENNKLSQFTPMFTPNSPALSKLDSVMAGFVPSTIPQPPSPSMVDEIQRKAKEIDAARDARINGTSTNTDGPLSDSSGTKVVKVEIVADHVVGPSFSRTLNGGGP